MVHTNPEIETSNLILDFEFDQHLESRKHVINIIMWFRDMGCYKWPMGPALVSLPITTNEAIGLSQASIDEHATLVYWIYITSM
jgi:hypothetical protein